jgi:hypothetical protein
MVLHKQNRPGDAPHSCSIITLRRKGGTALTRPFVSHRPATTGELESAFDRLKGFVGPRTKRLLVVEDNAAEQETSSNSRYNDLEISTVSTSAEARCVAHRPFDCCVRPSAAGHDRL